LVKGNIFRMLLPQRIYGIVSGQSMSCNSKESMSIIIIRNYTPRNGTNISLCLIILAPFFNFAIVLLNLVKNLKTFILSMLFFSRFLVLASRIL